MHYQVGYKEVISCNTLLVRVSVSIDGLVTTFMNIQLL